MPQSSLISLPALFIPFSLLAAPEAVKVEVLQNKLDHPWSLPFLPDNQGLLVTLKDGQLKRWQAGKGLSDPIVGVPKSGQTVREDCWTWSSPRILNNRAASG
ncbi:glucose sorbosone dehydrogenase [Enterobacter asburiae]|uniref:Glucose sorbosone dehydrogenase n=1 Tax=Enterobacter asburiae TaxID=61645 RepID=A0A376F5Z1_ENTAS|nr:glucose sorbosone dehydrogenase [Enterobacter asburiae]